MFPLGFKKRIIFALVVFAVGFGAFICTDIGWRYLPFSYDKLLLFFSIVWAAVALLVWIAVKVVKKRAK